MNLFKIIMFGILMTNFEVQGQRRHTGTVLYIPQGLYHQGTAINRQKLRRAIVSKVQGLKRVFDITFEQKLGTVNDNVLESYFSVTFAIKTKGGRIHRDVECEGQIVPSALNLPAGLLLFNCANEEIQLANTVIGIVLPEISNNDSARDFFFKEE